MHTLPGGKIANMSLYVPCLCGCLHSQEVHPIRLEVTGGKTFLFIKNDEGIFLTLLRFCNGMG